MKPTFFNVLLLLKCSHNSYNHYEMAENTWVTGVIAVLVGVITPFITSRGPPCTYLKYRSEIR